jgi:hypothetical protein
LTLRRSGLRCERGFGCDPEASRFAGRGTGEVWASHVLAAPDAEREFPVHARGANRELRASAASEFVDGVNNLTVADEDVLSEPTEPERRVVHGAHEHRVVDVSLHTADLDQLV